MSEEKELKLMLGCGPMPIHPQHLEIVDNTWTFIDLYVDDPKVVKMDVRKLEYPDNSASEIYASHVLEHISMREVTNTVAEWFRVLKPGGRIIINVPDFEWAIEEYMNIKHGKKPQSPVFDSLVKILEIIYGNQDHEGEFHKSAYNKAGLEKLLTTVGFKKVGVTVKYEAHEMGCLIAVAYK